MRSLIRSALLPNRVRIRDPRSLTTRSGHELPASSTGLERDAMERVWRSVVRYYRLGLQPAISICVRHRGEIVLDRAVGHARGNGPGDDPNEEKILATPDTRFSLASGSKPITAMAIHMLQERGKLHIDERASHHMHELRGTDKAGITMRQLLAHRAGLPSLPPGKVDLDILTDREAIIDALVNTEVSSAPGTNTAYHALSSGFILAEIVLRTTGRTLQEFVRDEIMRPTGIDLDYGVSPDQVDTIAREYFTGPRPVPALAKRLEASLGVDLRGAVRMANDPRFRTGVIPSGNITGTAREASQFFELLRRGGELNGQRIFDARTISRAIEDQGHGGFDSVIMLPIRYGLGFMLGGDRVAFFGRRSARAFGHLGFTNVLVWADPDRELSVALLNSGKPFLTPELGAWLAIPYELARQVPPTAA